MSLSPDDTTPSAKGHMVEGGGPPNPVCTTQAELAPRPTRSKIQTVLLFLALCISVFLAALDTTIITTALPTISSDFHSGDGYVWVGSAYLLAASAATPNWGKLSDIWGRKILLLIAVAIFFLGSTLCGTAVSIEMLIVGRAVQGAAGGGLLALVNIIIGDLFSQRVRGKYYGLIGLVWAVAAALGSLVGGAFTSRVTWRWCFYLNLPTSAAAFIAIAFTLKLETPKTPFLAGIKAIDWLGSLTLTGGTIMVLLGLQLGGAVEPWGSAKVVALIVAGVVTWFVFALVEWRIAYYPIVSLHIFSNTSNVAAILVDFSHGVVFTTAAFFLPLYFQAVLGASPLLSGVWILPFAVTMGISAAGAGVYLKRTGRYLDCIRLGFVLAVIGAGLLYTLPDEENWGKIIGFQLLIGIGVGINFQPPLLALQNNVPAQENGTVTAMFSLVRNFASATAVVIGLAAFTNGMIAQQDAVRSALGSDAAGGFSGNNAQAAISMIASLPTEAQVVLRTAYLRAVQDIWIVTVCFAGAGLIACLFITKRKLGKIHEEVKTGLEGEEARRQIALARGPKKDLEPGTKSKLEV